MKAVLPFHRTRHWRLARDLAAFVVFGGLVIAFVVQGALRLDYDWQWARVWPYLIGGDEQGGFRPGVLLQGLAVTIQIVALALVATLAIGLSCAVLQRSGSVVGRALVRTYVEVSRNTPLLVLLFLIYFVVAPIIGVDRFYAGVIGLALYEGAFAAEIFRAGIESVPRGQWEAARALSLSKRDTYRRIIIPQSVRLILPPLTNLMVSLIKDSTLISVIAVAELMTMARDVVSETFMAFEVWFTVAAMYLVLTTSISLYAHRAESRLKGVAE